MTGHEHHPTLRARLPRRPEAAPAARIAVTGALPGPLPGGGAQGG